ncbi:MAG: NADH-quinone oxidoreductase subunit NuoE [Candidatus Edwardsbacteria bacterium]|nr:NADH-quinone oxidoreductase subunit NuoE [Candidatus Edwardsbacteria bacterium]
MKKKAVKKARRPKDQKQPNDRAVIARIVAHYASNKGAVIPVLQEVQAALGWLSQETLTTIADGLQVPISQIYGVATFYTQFRLKPAGKHLVRVCHGTACHVSGAGKISEALKSSMGVGDGETTADGRFTVESVACLGCCSLAPVIMVDSETYGRLTPDSAQKAVKEF